MDDTEAAEVETTRRDRTATGPGLPKVWLGDHLVALGNEVVDDVVELARSVRDLRLELWARLEQVDRQVRRDGDVSAVTAMGLATVVERLRPTSDWPGARHRVLRHADALPAETEAAPVARWLRRLVA